MGRIGWVLFIFLTGFGVSVDAVYATAEDPTCSKWHSCPSETGKYVCGDLGFCAFCPDNQFCLKGKIRKGRIKTDLEKGSASTSPGIIPSPNPTTRDLDLSSLYDSISRPENLKGKRISDWIVYGDGTLLDLSSGLMWMAEDFRSLKGNLPLNWEQAMEFADRSNAQAVGGYVDWMVPDIKEYQTLLHRPKTLFAHSSKNWYWTREKVGRCRYYDFEGGETGNEYCWFARPASNARLVRKAGTPEGKIEPSSHLLSDQAHIKMARTQLHRKASTALKIYARSVQRIIMAYWGKGYSETPQEVLIHFTLNKDGTITPPELQKKSIDENLNRMALEAVQYSAPFPSMPRAIQEKQLGFTVKFRYTR